MYIWWILESSIRIQKKINATTNHSSHLFPSQFHTYVRVLKAHSHLHSMSGGSIWASLEYHRRFWIARGLMLHLSDYSPPAFQKWQWQSQEAQIEPPLVKCEWAFRVRALVHNYIQELKYCKTGECRGVAEIREQRIYRVYKKKCPHSKISSKLDFMPNYG